MSITDLRLILDYRDNYHRGDVVRGRVAVTVGKTASVSSLDVETLWRSSGEGSADGATIERISAFRGELKPGDYEFPFELTIRHHVYSYYGDLFSIRWFVRASLERRFLPAMTDLQEIVYAPGEEHARDNLRLGKSMQREGVLAPPPRALQLGLYAVGGAMAMGSVGLSWVAANPLLLGALAGVGGVMVWGRRTLPRLHDWASDQVVANATVSLDRKTCVPGEAFSASVEILLHRPLAETGHFIELVCAEVTDIDLTSRQVSNEHVVFSQRKVLALPRNTRPGQPYALTQDFTVPLGAPQTFHGKHNRIEWSLVLTLHAKRFIVWQEEAVIDVQYRG